MKAIILLSGGVDSCVVLAMALKEKRECLAISFDYGQRHKIELKSAEAIAKFYDTPLKLIALDPTSFAHSSLVSKTAVLKDRSAEEIAKGGIPSSYVPGRNTIFLAYAASQAEIFNADEIHIGPNALDRNPYPDCRPEYIQAFQQLLNLATKQAVEGSAPKLVAPLIEMDKTEIIKQGMELDAPLHLTFSCYDPSKTGDPCGRCDACVLRNEAFNTWKVNKK